MIKAIIFDFDGVLGNTYKINFDLSKEFYPQTTEQDFLDHHNGNVFLEPKIHFKKSDIEPFFTKQRALFTKAHFFPIIQHVHVLHPKYKLFIISGMTDGNIKHFLQLDNYHKLFEKILGMTTHKSKEVRFKMIFNDYDIAPRECIFITDTIGDIKEAKKVHVPVIAVTWGYHSEELLKKHQPDSVVRNEDELMKEIDRLAS